MNSFTPYRTSITPNFAIFHISILNKYRSFFAFLQRHSARAAHEVQKAYISTAQWYYETGFRRYVRALERIRARSVVRTELVGSVASESSLSLFSRQGASSVSNQGPRSSVDTLHGPNIIQRSEESGVILAYRADEPDFVREIILISRCVCTDLRLIITTESNARRTVSFNLTCHSGQRKSRVCIHIIFLRSTRRFLPSGHDGKGQCDVRTKTQPG